MRVSVKKKVTALVLAALLGFGLLTAQINHKDHPVNANSASGYNIVADGSIIPPPTGR